MALSRSFLKALGIEPEKVDQIISAHTETVDGLKAEAEKYKEEAAKVPGLQKKVEGLEKSNSDGTTTYKEKYEKEHQEFENFKTQQKIHAAKEKSKASYRALLKEAGVSDKHIDAVLKASDTSQIEYDEDGKVKDSEKLIDGIKKEWGDFIVNVKKKGVDTPDPPKGDDGNGSPDDEYAKKYVDSLYSNMYGVAPGADGDNGTNGGAK